MVEIGETITTVLPANKDPKGYIILESVVVGFCKLCNNWINEADIEYDFGSKGKKYCLACKLRRAHMERLGLV